MSERERKQPAGLWRLFALAFVTGLSGAMMPGPVLVAVIGQTTAQGFRAVLGLITGHALLELAIVALLMAGLRATLRRPAVRGAIGLVGGAVLVWMGGDMVASAGEVSLSLNAQGSAAASWPLLLLWGAGLSAANPYFSGWWATVGAGQLAHMAPQTRAEYGAFYLGHEAADYGWYSAVGLAIVSGRGWLLENTGIYRALLCLCGAAIVGLGLWFVYCGAALVLRRKAGEGRDQTV